MAAQPAPEYLAWREQEVKGALEGLPDVNAKGKPLTKAQKSKQERDVQESYPPDLLACLQVDTAWLQALGWNQPPGSRKVFYWRRADSLEGAAPQTHPRRLCPEPVAFMLLAMATASGNLHALPPVTRVLPQGELLHRALLSRAGEGDRRSPSVLSGRDEDGRPLRSERGIVMRTSSTWIWTVTGTSSTC